jgi:hypothetical protein
MAEDLFGPLPDQAISMDVDAFDRLVRSQGLTFVHYRAVPCPIGLVDPNDMRRPHENHSGCSNGYIYIKAGEITCAFSGNRSDRACSTSASGTGRLRPSPSLASTTAKATSPLRSRRATASTCATPPPWWSPRSSSKLTRPASTACASRRPSSSTSSTGRAASTSQGADFNIEGGRIKWVGPRRPQKSSHAPHGPTCSVRYRYIPFWYVTSLLHELRLIQVTNPASGERSVRRMPYQLLLQRENVYEGSTMNDPLSKTDENPVGRRRPPPRARLGLGNRNLLPMDET